MLAMQDRRSQLIAAGLIGLFAIFCIFVVPRINPPQPARHSRNQRSLSHTSRASRGARLAGKHSAAAGGTSSLPPGAPGEAWLILSVERY